jgi:4'-phosphopantetheinyl transferase
LSYSQWRSEDGAVKVDSGEVLIVSARVTGRCALIDVLDADERLRLSRLQRADDRNRFIDAHALLRIVVGDATGLDPHRVRLIRRCQTCGGPHGRPLLVEPPGLHLSLSHAGARVMVALTDHGPVGVDVEAVDAARFEGIEHVGLATSERLTFTALQHSRRMPASRALAIWWTRKEAVLKCTGYGLAVDPRAVVVTAPTQAPALTDWTGPGTIASMQLVDLDVGTGYAACVAIETSVTNPVRLRLRDATERLASWADQARTTTA